MDKKKLMKIIEIVCTAIISVATVLLVESCTVSLSVQKQNSSSTLNTDQTNRVDSASANLDLRK